MIYVKRLLSTLMILVLLCSALLLTQPQSAQAATYNDISRHWARDVIVRWEALGALADFPSGAFKPNAAITRAEFFSMLVNAFGATEMADISHFTDVPEGAWYYDVVAKAAQMRIATGVGENTMKPTQNIVRQDAATIVARAMGLQDENANYLYRYNDSGSISDYARNYVSAITERGYMSGSYGNFNPRAYLSRAEAVQIIDNLFTHYYRPEVGFDNFALTGNVMSLRTNSVFNDLTVNGDLILTDGVGQGSATLNNCTINGRLLIRGGGSSSIVLNNTRVTDGIVVISPSSFPRIVSNAGTSVPQLTAYSSFILSGTGVYSAYIADDAFADTDAILEGVMLSTMYAGGVGNSVDLREGRITNLHVAGAADNTACVLAQGALVDYFSTANPYTNVTGTGTIADAFINAPGATLAMTPNSYTVGANLSATIGGKAVAGRVLPTANNVTRHTSSLAVSQDADQIGGENIRISSTQGRSSNTVLVTQTPYSLLPMEHMDNRWGYYIGFFIPAPSGRGNNDIQLLTYVNSDGGLVTMEGVSLTRKGGVYGLEFHIPVIRGGKELRGFLNETMYIQWDNQYTENLQFHSGWLNLESLTGTQEESLLDQYEEQRFRGYDGTRYTGAEALQRLLASDNALGLDVQGFGSFETTDQEDLAARLLELSSDFDSKQMVQDMVNQTISGKAAMFAVNNAVTVAQMRQAVENEYFAKELNIASTSGSLYGLLSNLGKDYASNIMLKGRTKDFANNAAVKTAFDKAVADTRTLENLLLVALNAARKPAEAQNLVETKKNAELLKFYPDEDPYRGYAAALKQELGQRLLDHKPYYSVDDVARIIEDFLLTVKESGVEPSATITGIKADPTSISLVIGQEATFNITVSTSTGFLSNLQDVTFTNSNENAIFLDKDTLTITGKAAGSGKITASITDAGSKKTYTATISVTVKTPIPATSVKLNKSYEEVGEGENNVWLIATMTPANSTDTLIWTSADPSIVEVDQTGRLSGITPGFTTVGVRTSSNQTAFCEVAVISKDPGIMLNPEEATIGIGEILTIKYAVSPISLPNRTVKWRTSNAQVATVDSYGTVTGLAEGQATITAISNYDPNLTANCVITVDPNIRQISLNKIHIVMVPGGKETLTATVRPDMEIGDSVKWGRRAAIPGTSGAQMDKIATVDPDTGVVTATGPGTIYVSAYLLNHPEVTAECEVEVMDRTLTIKPNPLNITVEVNNTVVTSAFTFDPSRITNKYIEWTMVPATGIASFTKNGNGSLSITGISAGTATITGVPDADSSQTIRVNVTVKNVAVTNFVLSTDHIYLDEGDTRVLTDWTDPNMIQVYITPSNATDKTITWSSNNIGQVTITNQAATTANPYGPSEIVANSTTYTKEVQYIKEDGTTGTRMDDVPVEMVAVASNGQQKKVLVTVRPQNSQQTNNIKIDVERWVYAVGEKQYLSVYFNVIGRVDGRWLTDIQPPNKELTWTTSDDSIAYVLPTGELVAVKPGIVRITATTKVGGRSDTVTLVIGQYGINSMTFSGISQATGYGRFLEMYVGEEADVTANFSPSQAANSRVVWQPWLWEYTNTNENDTAGDVDADASKGRKVLNIVSSANPWSTAHLTGLTPGLVRVSVIPVDENDNLNPDKISTVSINELQTLAGAKFNEYLEKNSIVEVSGDYYTKNEDTLYIPNLPSSGAGLPIVPAKLSATQPMPLIVPSQANTNDFFVWVKSRTPQSLSFVTPAGAKITPGQQITLATRLTPALTDDEITVAWSVTSGNANLQLVPSSEGYNSATQEYYAVFEAQNNIDTTATVTITATRAAEKGIKSSISGNEWRTNPSVNLSATYVVSIVDTITPGFAPLQIAAPLTTTVPEQTATQPVETAITSPSATYPSYTEAPVYETLLSVTTSKILKLRSAATVMVGRSIKLNPVLSPGNYDPTGLTWVSSKPDIATVDANGIIYGVKAGKTTITLTVPGTKLTAKCTVTVAATLKNPVSSITLSSGVQTLEEGKTTTLKATISPTNASAKGVSWFSSNNAVATVDAAGKVTAAKAGATTISAITDDGGHVATCTVTVTPKPIKVTGVTLSQKTLTLLVGDQYTLEYTITPADASNQEIRWATSNANVVTVNNGQITAIKKGSAVITVITADGSKRATCRVTVK